MEREIFSPHERHLPEARPETIQWAEFCNPWNGAWPYVDRAYRTPGYVLMELVKCRAWGINYLLGIGPMASGDLAPQAYENLDLLEKWMTINKEAIYQVRPLPISETASVLASAKDTHRYLYLTREFNMRGTRVGSSESDMVAVQDEVIVFQGVDAPIKEVVYMPTGLPLDYEFNDGKLTIKVLAKDRSTLVDIIRITFME